MDGFNLQFILRRFRNRIGYATLNEKMIMNCKGVKGNCPDALFTKNLGEKNPAFWLKIESGTFRIRVVVK
jgi:hypothetical protein